MARASSQGSSRWVRAPPLALLCARPRRWSASATKAAIPDEVRKVVAEVQPDAKRLAIFVSGNGSNMQMIHAGILSGYIKGDIVVGVTDNPACAAVEYLLDIGAPVLVHPVPPRLLLESTPHDDAAFGPLCREDLMRTPDELQCALLDMYGVEYAVLAGYKKLVPASLVRTFRRRMLNIHPALLPAFGGRGMFGMRVHKAVIASGARVSGPTVHFVDATYDTGPILAQRAVPVYPNDTPEALALRVLREEHNVYPEAVAALCSDAVEWRGDGVPFIWTVV